MQIRNRKKLFIIYFLSLFLCNLNLAADEFNITAKEILIDKENEILIGKGSVQAVDSEGKRIIADKITYEKSREFLLAEGNVKIIVKGHIHTEVLIKAVLKRDLNLIGKKRLSHVWHMTLDADDKPFIITDGVLNVLPKLEVKMHILRNAVNFANKIGIARPKVSVLSATEEILKSVPSSIEAQTITKKAKEENINADVFGPLAFDNSVSKKAAAIKKIKNEVAGSANILLVPNVETGNALVKMMIYFLGACAAGVVIGGKVPVVITSRADDSEARLASIAAAIVALD